MRELSFRETKLFAVICFSVTVDLLPSAPYIQPMRERSLLHSTTHVLMLNVENSVGSLSRAGISSVALTVFHSVILHNLFNFRNI